MLILLILAVFLICLFEGVPLIKKGLWRELGTLGFLIATAIYLGITDIAELPTPINWLQQLLNPVGEVIFK